MNLSLLTPRRIAAIAIAGILALGSIAPAQAARVQEASVKSVIKVGAKCTKLNAKAKVGSVSVVCKRINGKLIWAKVAPSAECKSARAQYNTQLESYNKILSQLADAKKSLEGIAGTDADALRTQITDLEKGVQPLAALVKQFKTLADQICAIS
jgi:hypothetical protein